MIRYSTIFLIIVCLFSCTYHEPHNGEAVIKDSTKKDISKKNDSLTSPGLGYFQLYGDSLIIPSFEIEVSLSEKANAKLKANKETIIVSASFTGTPKDTTSEEYIKSGEMGIASHDIELRDSRIAKFEGVKFLKSLYDSLADKDIQLLINIFSGRRSTGDNLLNCDIIQDKMSNIKGRRFTLKCKLIYGDQ